jgi:hypothetical protein
VLWIRKGIFDFSDCFRDLVFPSLSYQRGSSIAVICSICNLKYIYIYSKEGWAIHCVVGREFASVTRICICSRGKSIAPLPFVIYKTIVHKLLILDSRLLTTGVELQIFINPLDLLEPSRRYILPPFALDSFRHGRGPIKRQLIIRGRGRGKKLQTSKQICRGDGESYRPSLDFESLVRVCVWRTED